jgi:hypothetical protein
LQEKTRKEEKKEQRRKRGRGCDNIKKEKKKVQALGRELS